MCPSWNRSKLSEFAAVKYGKATPHESGTVPVIGSGGLFASTAKPLVGYPTLIVGRKGTAGKVWFQQEPSWPSDTTFYLEWKNDLIDSGYLYYVLQARPLSGEHARTTMPSIQRQDLENYELFVPPIQEQRAVAQTLQTVQRANQSRQREVALEHERKAALMECLFAHGTRGNGGRSKEIGEIHKDWALLTLTEVATIERGKFTHRPRNAPEFYGGAIPFIQTGDVTASNGHITKHSQTLNEKGLSVSRVFPKGTIVITIAANIGFTAVLDFDSAFPDSLIGITPNETIDAEFLNYYLSTQQPEMDRKAPRGTQKNINIEFLSPWPVLVPPLDEQRAIAQTLSCCDKKIESLRQEIALLNELFDAMLENLMTGQLSSVPLAQEGLSQ